MPAQILRDYQRRGIEQIFAAWKQGAKSVLMVLPTAGGKTTIFGSIVAQLAAKGHPTLINVHRRELATQASNRLREFGIDYGLIMAGEQPKPYALAQIASVQTLVRRKAPPARLVVNDEAHLSTAKTWRTIMDQYPDARILGVTATPWRLSGKPLSGAYDAVVVVATPRELREAGHLCDYVGFSYRTPDLSDVKTTAGEYNEAQAAEAMGASVIVDNVVEEWLKHASSLSTVVFAVTVEHSKTLTERFRAAGVAAEHLDGSTPVEARRAILRRVESGQTRVLCNVGVAVEGLDIPRLKCCVLARPTKSLARAIQMMGRVRRPWEGVTARIHDHAFVIRSHGLPDDDRDYSLDAKPERPAALSTCSECLALFTGNFCPSCSHENEPQIVGEREIQTIPDAEQYSFSSSETPELPPVEIKWNRIGRVVEGVLTEKKIVTTDYGKQRRYIVRGEERTYDVPGTTALDARLSVILEGTKIRLTYVDDLPLPGDRVKKRFKVEVDDGT